MYNTKSPGYEHYHDMPIYMYQPRQYQPALYDNYKMQEQMYNSSTVNMYRLPGIEK